MKAGEGHAGRSEHVLRQRRPWLVLALLIVTTLSVLAATPAGRQQLTVSFRRVPAPYVALAFPAVPAVPVAENGRELIVVFTVVGHDGAAATLPYEVDVSDAVGRRVAVRSGATTVRPEQSTRESVTVDLPHGASWGRLDVRLVGRTEAISVRNRSAVS